MGKQMADAKWQMTNAKWQMMKGCGTAAVPAR
jgi:hypothetical protein